MHIFFDSSSSSSQDSGDDFEYDNPLANKKSDLISKNLDGSKPFSSKMATASTIPNATNSSSNIATKTTTTTTTTSTIINNAPVFIKDPDTIQEVANVSPDFISLKESQFLDDLVLGQYAELISSKYNIHVVNADVLHIIAKREDKQAPVLDIDLEELRNTYGIKQNASWTFYSFFVSRREHVSLIRITANDKALVEINVYDSLHTPGPINQTSNTWKEAVLPIKYIIGEGFLFGKCVFMECPQQTNGFDCGLMSLAALENLLSNPNKWEYSQKNMNFYRKWVLFKLTEKKVFNNIFLILST
uniref:Ubiquitin-like protease family profile domain-containing protein n=1 Tax=Meloidogyne enterolobii TaxID=390850 RepID=A0A6V7U8E5_MELEN|nr:unnamed protein product [Meloidogyne enterolobii]